MSGTVGFAMVVAFICVVSVLAFLLVSNLPIEE